MEVYEEMNLIHANIFPTLCFTMKQPTPEVFTMSKSPRPFIKMHLFKFFLLNIEFNYFISVTIKT